MKNLRHPREWALWSKTLSKEQTTSALRGLLGIKWYHISLMCTQCLAQDTQMHSIEFRFYGKGACSVMPSLWQIQSRILYMPYLVSFTPSNCAQISILLLSPLWEEKLSHWEVKWLYAATQSSIWTYVVWCQRPQNNHYKHMVCKTSGISGGSSITYEIQTGEGAGGCSYQSSLML